MSEQPRARQRAADRLAGTLLLAGLAGVALRHWRAWRAEAAWPSAAPPTPTLVATPSVSILVAAWNAAEHLPALLADVARLRYPCRELVLCAGGPDGSAAVAARLAGPRVILLRQEPGEGKQAALRRALTRASGEIVFLTDADCRLDDEVLTRTLAPVIVGAAVASSGGSRPHPEHAADPFVLAQASGPLWRAHRPDAPRDGAGLLGRNAAVRRDALERTRALDYPAPTGTDYVLAQVLARHGMRVRQTPDSRIATAYPRTPAAYLRQQRRWLRTLLVHGWRFGAWADVRAAATSVLAGLAMLALPLADRWWGRWPAALWAGLLLHGLLARLRYLSVAARLLGVRLTPRHVLGAAGVLLLDLAAWSLTPFDCLTAAGRGRW